MGAFGSGREDYKEMTPAARSAADMQERRPVLNGPDKDTFISEDGRHFVMNREVNEEEYNAFLEKYKVLVEHELAEKRSELENAA